MSSDREARILGAGVSFQVGEKEYTLNPIASLHLCNLEREALKFYKRQYLETFRDNADLLGDNSDEVLMKKVEEVAHWTLEDIPQKTVYSMKQIPVTDQLKRWLKNNLEEDDELPDTDDGFRAVLSTFLDMEKISSKSVKKLTGKFPQKGRIRFDQWWVTANTEGMISFVASSLDGVREQMKGVVKRWPPMKIIEAARAVEDITTADLGNT